MFVDRLASFTDREPILAQFGQMLHAAQPGQFHLLTIKGNSGTGKTFLIEYLVRYVCPLTDWQVGQLAFAQSIPDFRPILEGLEDALRGCVPGSSLQQYRDKREVYKRSFDDYRTAITINLKVEAKEQSHISDIHQNVLVNTELRRRELQLRTELTRALLELAEESQRPLCLFIDGYERFVETDTELVGWLWEEVLLKLARTAPHPLLVVTCGWEIPSNPDVKPFSHAVELDDFDLLRLRSYLEKQEVIATDSTSSEQEELVAAFYELTKGHPLVLSLAVTYFNELEVHERTAHSLQADRPLVDERARIEFLEERLLLRLQEPYRTILKWGSILRLFDQTTLQALLQVNAADILNGASRLDDRAYDRFIRYPFVRQVIAPGSNTFQFSFHELIRRVGLSALQHHHPQTKERLHRKMLDYYMQVLTKAQGWGDDPGVPISFAPTPDSIFFPLPLKGLQQDLGDNSGSIQENYLRLLSQFPESAYKAYVEYLYHAFQTKELQVEAFKTWRQVVPLATTKGYRLQARTLLELVRQLEEEGELFLSKTSEPYGQYLFYYSQSLEQDLHLDDATAILEKAIKTFEQIHNLAYVGICLNNIGDIYRRQEKWEQAFRYHESALALREKIGDSFYIAQSLGNIGTMFYDQGEWDKSLQYLKRALALFEGKDDPDYIARTLNNIGGVYLSIGDLEQALSYFERILPLYTEIDNPLVIVPLLRNMGFVYGKLGKWDQALECYERVLRMSEEVSRRTDDLTDVARALRSIGDAKMGLSKWDQALEHYQQALTLYEQINDHVGIAALLNNMGTIYNRLGKWEEALRYHERALPLFERLGEFANAAISLNNIAFVYREQKMWDQAIEWYTKAFQCYERLGQGFESDVAYELEGLSVCHLEAGEREKALDYYGRALIIKSQANIGNPADLAALLNRMGDIYYEQGKWEEALRYLKQALLHLEQLGNVTEIAVSLHNIASTYQKQEEWKEAITYYTKSLAIYESMGSGFEAGVADELAGLTVCYAELNDLDQMMSCLERCQKIRENLKKNN